MLDRPIVCPADPAGLLQAGGVGDLFQPLVEHVKVETLLALRDALAPEARVPLGSDPGPTAAPDPARAAAGGGAGADEADADGGLMDLDDDGPGPGPGPGPSGGGGRGGPAPDEVRMLPPLTRPAPIVEDEEEGEKEEEEDASIIEENDEEDTGAAAASASPAGGRATPSARAERRDARGGRAGAAAGAGRGAAAARVAGGATQSAGERAARVLPVTFALAEAGLDALAADTAAAEALADGGAAPGDPLPLLSQGCAGAAHVRAQRDLFLLLPSALTHISGRALGCWLRCRDMRVRGKQWPRPSAEPRDRRMHRRARAAGARRVAQRALMSLAEAAEGVLQFLEALRGQPARWGDPLLPAAVRALGRSATRLACPGAARTCGRRPVPVAIGNRPP